MIKKLAIILIFSIFFGCKEKFTNVSIILSRTEKNDSTQISLNKLYLSNLDTTILKLQKPNRFNFKDTIKIEKVPIGTYSLEYIDILGNKILKNIKITENPCKLNILTDSINTEKVKTKIPFVNLKNNQSYSIEMKGGSVSSYSGYYKICRIENTYYFESFLIRKRILENSEIEAIKKFESELLSIDGKYVCSNTGKNTYTINNGTIKAIEDNTCNWNGWSNLFSNLKK